MNIEEFKVGLVYVSPKGYNYKVIEVNGVQAVMRLGSHGLGRMVRRNKYKTKNWREFEEESE